MPTRGRGRGPHLVVEPIDEEGPHEGIDDDRLAELVALNGGLAQRALQHAAKHHIVTGKATGACLIPQT